MNRKPFKTIDEQISILQNEKKLIIDDEDAAKYCLKELNYYRLSGYTLALRKNDVFYKGIQFSDVMQVYNFDRDLKLCLLRYLEDIEISLRTHIAYELGQYDFDSTLPISYSRPEMFVSEAHYEEFQTTIRDAIKDNREEAFVKHHISKYNGVLPVWAMVETLSFGKASSFFAALNIDVKKRICDNYYHIRYSVLENLLESLVVLRNLCAHHARLCNRGLPVKPLFSKTELDYFVQQKYGREEIGNRLFFRLPIIIRLSSNPEITANIISDIHRLQQRYPFVNLRHYGFRNNWEEILRTLSESDICE